MEETYKNKLTGIIRVAEKMYYPNRFSPLENDIEKNLELT